MVSFGLGYQKKSPRIAAATEAYPGRWTHPVIVERAEEPDDELLSRLNEAYLFSLAK